MRAIAAAVLLTVVSTMVGCGSGESTSQNASSFTATPPAPTGDTLAPSIPTGVTATAMSSTAVQIAWAASTDQGGSGLGGYRVQRNGSQITMVTTPGYIDSGLQPGTQYTYTVSAYDQASPANQSVPSIAVSVTTQNAPPVQDTQAPSVPVNVQGTVNSSGAIVLTWGASTDTGGSGLAGYRVMRGGAQLAMSTLTTHTDATVSPSTAYSYTVIAVDAAGNQSAASAAVAITTPATPPIADTTAPTPPGNLQATVNASGAVVLAWAAATDTGGSGLAGYRINRGGVQLATSSQLGYVDSAVAPSTTYSYTVMAVDGAGNLSGASNSASATTPATAPPPTGAPGAHPRVWINAERLNNLRTHVSTNSAQWRIIKARADLQIGRGTTYTADYDEWMLGDLGVACLVGNDARYAQRAGEILRQYAVETNTLQRDSAYDYRHLPSIVMGYDWCYNGFSTALRQQVATWFMNRADWLWPETNSTRRNAWGVSMPANNYFWGFMMLGPAALTAYGDDTGVGAISGSNRPQYHIDLVRTKWSTLVTPMVNGWIRGGVFAEGTNYESARPMGLFADAFNTALTDTTYVALPVFREMYKWQFHQVAPDLQHYVYLGEQARDSEGGIIYYERSNHLILASFPGVASAAEKSASYFMVQQWPLRQSDAQLSAPAMDIVYWDPAVTPAANAAGLPLSFYDPASGVFVHRTSWTDPNATLLFMESGKILESHQLFNANGLMIWKGGYWVLGHGQMWDRNYDLSQSSTLYTSGEQQRWQEATNGGGVTLAAEVNASYVYWAGQAKDAYGRATTRPLTDFVRKVVYLPGLDAVVVTDRVGKTNAADVLTWKWWARGLNAAAPTVSGNSFSFQNRDGTATMYGESLVAGGTSTSQQTGTGGSFVQTVRTSGTTADFAVTAMRLGTVPGASVVDAVDRSHVRIGAWHVAVGKNELAATSLTFSSDAASFVVTDLVPNATYAVSGGGASATTTTSQYGVATFNLTAAGSRSVTLTRQ